MEVLVLTAAWLEILTVPGMAYPVPGITQRAHMQKGETESSNMSPRICISLVYENANTFFSSVPIPQK